MSRQLIIVLTILTNLLIGNSILFFGVSDHGSVNYDLMIGMSLACVVCYILAFRTINFLHRGRGVLLLFSYLTCFAIVLLGCTITSVITGFRMSDQSVSDFFMNILIGLVLGGIGNIGQSYITIPLAVLNLIWYLMYQKVVIKENNNINC